MVHSRNDEEVGMAHEVKSSENQPQISQKTMGLYWLGNFQINPKCFQEVAMEFEKNFV